MNAVVLLVNITAEQRPAYESFVAQQSSYVNIDPVLKDILTFEPAVNKSSYLSMMYIIQWAPMFGDVGDEAYLQNKEITE